MADKWEQIAVEGLKMRAFAARPDGRGPFPGIVIAIHGPGVDRFILETCRRLAAQGYYAVAPDLYHRHELPQDREQMLASRPWEKLMDPQIIADTDAAVRFLQGNASVDRERLGIVGFCMGGRTVLVMAAVSPAFKAAVAFYGGNIGVSRGPGPTPLERLANVHCPVMGFFGDLDTNPSPEDMGKLDAELTKHGKAHEFHSYSGAGHAYMDSTNPARYNEAAAKASWPITLAFLEKHLGRVRAASR